MVIAKLKLACVIVLALSVLLTGAGMVAWQLAAQPPVAQQIAQKDKDALQGTWKVVSAMKVGIVDAEAERKQKQHRWVFKGDRVGIRFKPESESDFTLDPSKQPREIDVIPREGDEAGKTFRGIYEVKGDDLKLTFNGAGLPRPTTFDEAGAVALVLKRDKEKE